MTRGKGSGVSLPKRSKRAYAATECAAGPRVPQVLPARLAHQAPLPGSCVVVGDRKRHGRQSLHNTAFSCERRLDEGARGARANGPPLVSCNALLYGLSAILGENTPAADWHLFPAQGVSRLAP